MNVKKIIKFWVKKLRVVILLNLKLLNIFKFYFLVFLIIEKKIVSWKYVFNFYYF